MFFLPTNPSGWRVIVAPPGNHRPCTSQESEAAVEWCLTNSHIVWELVKHHSTAASLFWLVQARPILVIVVQSGGWFQTLGRAYLWNHGRIFSIQIILKYLDLKLCNAMVICPTWAHESITLASTLVPMGSRPYEMHISESAARIYFVRSPVKLCRPVVVQRHGFFARLSHISMPMGQMHELNDGPMRNFTVSNLLANNGLPIPRSMG